MPTVGVACADGPGSRRDWPWLPTPNDVSAVATAGRGCLDVPGLPRASAGIRASAVGGAGRRSGRSAVPCRLVVPPAQHCGGTSFGPLGSQAESWEFNSRLCNQLWLIITDVTRWAPVAYCLSRHGF